MFPFPKHYIPGRVDLTTIIKSAIVEEKVKVVRDGKSTTTKTFKGTEWGPKQQDASERIK